MDVQARNVEPAFIYTCRKSRAKLPKNVNCKSAAIMTVNCIMCRAKVASLTARHSNSEKGGQSIATGQFHMMEHAVLLPYV